MIDANEESATSQPLPDILTPEEIAAYVRWPLSSILRRLRSGELPGVPGGTRGGWRIRRSDFEKWWDKQIREYQAEQKRKAELDQQN